MVRGLNCVLSSRKVFDCWFFTLHNSLVARWISEVELKENWSKSLWRKNKVKRVATYNLYKDV